MRRKGVKYAKGEPIGCPKCGYQTKETKELSMSSEWAKVKYFLSLCGINFVTRLSSLIQDKKVVSHKFSID